MHEVFLQRCCDLANLATASVSPNPRVGAVLVHHGRIIGEGYHKQAGQAHAEVNCIASVADEDQSLISDSTLYVSLEPCCFHGRTPACTGLILKYNIPRVVIGQRDKTVDVNGQGVQILQDAGVEVIELAEFKPAEKIVAPRQLFAANNRPYVLLKFAQSADGFLAPFSPADYWITNPLSRRITHFWRSRTSAIIIGAGTLMADNPQLNTRLYPGPQPIPIVVDPKGKIQDDDYRLLHRTDGVRPILLQPKEVKEIDNCQQIHIDFPTFVNHDYRSSNPVYNQNANAVIAANSLITQLFKVLHDLGCNHVTVEGGSWLLSQFINANIWDEARVFTGSSTYFKTGVEAPKISSNKKTKFFIGNDILTQWYND